MTKLDEILSTLQVGGDGVDHQVLEQLVKEARRMERGLIFYADPDNWFDHIPMLLDGEGDRTLEDDGYRAQWTLRQHDVMMPAYSGAKDAQGRPIEDADEPEGDGSPHKEIVLVPVATTIPGGPPTKTLQ